jgi:hypothetical protein
MLESIKKTLSDCSGLPMTPPYSCLLSCTLANTIEKIKSLSYKEFLDVLEHAKKLVLPEDFLKELENRMHSYRQKP